MSVASGSTDLGKISFSYDSLKRLDGASVWQGSNRLLSTFYNYRTRTGEDGNTYSTNRVNQRNVYFGTGMTVADIVYGERFYYDAVGNITSVYEGYTRTGNSSPLAMNGYTYDSLNQLMQEVMCFPLSSGAGIYYNYTYDFTYDGGGNITGITEKDSRQGNAVVAEKTLSYENTVWGDLLTSVTKGSTTHNLFYDGMGNPITYGNGDKL